MPLETISSALTATQGPQQVPSREAPSTALSDLCWVRDHSEKILGCPWATVGEGGEQCIWKDLSPRSVAMPRLLLSSELVRWHRKGCNWAAEGTP